MRDKQFSYEEKVEEEEVIKLFEGINVNVKCDEKITVEFDERDIKVSNVIQNLLTLGMVEDLAITSASLENVIYDIYTSTKEEDAWKSI